MTTFYVQADDYIDAADDIEALAEFRRAVACGEISATAVAQPPDDLLARRILRALGRREEPFLVELVANMVGGQGE